MVIDATLLDIRLEKGCIQVIKKPYFFHLEKQPDNSYLAYVVRTSECWKNGDFDGSMASIRQQVPRKIKGENIRAQLIPTAGVESGENGVYRTPVQSFYACEVARRLYVRENDSLSMAEPGDWLISDGDRNCIKDSEAFYDRFTIQKNYDYSFNGIKPTWQKTKYGAPIIKTEKIVKLNSGPSFQ